MSVIFRSGILGFKRPAVLQLQQYSTAKSNLAVLRKNTGYSFSLCKKALETNNNNPSEAEKWLNQQAANLEWSKNKNVSARKTNQGLIGIQVVEGAFAAIFELNCETDFVARNEHFLNLLSVTAKTCVDHVGNSSLQPNGRSLTKSILDIEELKRTVTVSGKSLQDHLNLSIETIKENITFCRAMGFKVCGEDMVRVFGFTHPLTTLDNSVYYGKYGAVVVLKTSAGMSEDLPKNLCQHIVGLNPKKIGDPGMDSPNPDVDSEECLIYQEFLLDPSKTVQEVLKDQQVEILEFQRFGCDDEK